MKRLHILLTCSSLILVGLSFNRLTDFFLGHLSPHQFLRWVDFNAMLLLPVATLVVFYFIKHDVETKSSAKQNRWGTWLNLLFVLGAFVYGVSSGDHETTNYLHARYCDVTEVGGRICDIIAYHDDTFSHLLYYLGMVTLTLVLLATEWVMPRKRAVAKKDFILLFVNAVIIALAVFGNLAFEPAGIDIVAFSILALLSVGSALQHRSRIGRFPLTVYLALAYAGGLVATVLYKLLT